MYIYIYNYIIAHLVCGISDNPQTRVIRHVGSPVQGAVAVLAAQRAVDFPHVGATVVTLRHVVFRLFGCLCACLLVWSFACYTCLLF